MLRVQRKLFCIGIGRFSPSSITRTFSSVESEIPKSMEDIERKQKKDEKDTVIHWRRMSGHNTLWVPGIDHADIATQSSDGTKDHGQELVGSKIKVWWPGDQKFYYAVVESFDSVNMKHKVVYYDGDVEKLTLAKEKWKLIEGDAMSDQSFGGNKDHGEELVGSKIKVWWPGDQKFYYVVVESFNPVKMKHTVIYYDGDVEILKLAKEKWKLIEGDAMSDEEECTSDGESPDGVFETPKGKKVKTGEDLQTKHGKVETTPRTNTKPEQSSPKGEEAQEKEKSSSEAPEIDAKEKSPSLWKIQKKEEEGWESFSHIFAACLVLKKGEYRCLFR